MTINYGFPYYILRDEQELKKVDNRVLQNYQTVNYRLKIFKIWFVMMLPLINPAVSTLCDSDVMVPTASISKSNLNFDYLNFDLETKTAQSLSVVALYQTYDKISAKSSLRRMTFGFPTCLKESIIVKDAITRLRGGMNQRLWSALDLIFYAALGYLYPTYIELTQQASGFVPPFQNQKQNSLESKTIADLEKEENLKRAIFEAYKKLPDLKVKIAKVRFEDQIKPLSTAKHSYHNQSLGVNITKFGVSTKYLTNL